MAKRGQLTKKLQRMGEAVFGRPITQTELRLMPYAQSVLINDQHINFRKVNDAEKAILRQWQEDGYVLRIEPTFEVTKGFWEILNKFVYLAYVVHADQEDE